MSIGGTWEEEKSNLLTAAIAVKHFVSTGYHEFSKLVYDNQEIFAGIVGGIILLACARLLQLQRRKWIRKARRLFNLGREQQMTRVEYQAFQALRAANIVTDALEEAIFDGRLKRSYVNHLYRQLSSVWNMKSLRNKKIPKSQQLSNAELEQVLKILFNKQKPNIPGPKPGEVDNVTVFPKKESVVKTKKKLGDNIRRRHV